MHGINILIVDDEPLVSDLIRRKLSKTEPLFSITTVDSAQGCLDYIRNNPVECILSDYQMTGMDGMELLDHLRASGDTTPFIFVTGQGNEELAREAFKKGAHDYFTKEVGFAHFERITNSIHQAVSRRIAEIDRLRAERSLSEEKNKLEAVFSAISDGICIVDRDYKPVFHNIAYERIIGGHVGERCYNFIQGNDRICPGCPIEKTFSDGLVHRKRNLVRRETGDVLVDISSSPLRDHTGSIVAAVKVVRDVTEQSVSEQLVAESEDKFRTLAEKSPNMIFINLGGRVVYANELCEKVTGYTRDELYEPGFDFLCLVAPESRELVESNFQRHMQGENVEPYEYVLVTRPGERRTVILTTRLINYSGGRAILGIITDITARKMAEERLAGSEAMYRLMFMNSPVPMFAYDPATYRLLSANDAVLPMYGYSREEFLSLSVKDLHPPDDMTALKEFFATAPEGPRNAGVWRHVRKDGGIIYVDIVSHPVEFEGKKARVVLLKDVSRQVAAESELERSEKLNKAIVDAIPDIVFVMDREGNFLDIKANDNSELYVPAEKAIHRNIRDILPGDISGPAMEHIAATSETGAPRTYEYTLEMPDGPRRFEARLMPLGIDGHILSIVRDVTGSTSRAEEARRDNLRMHMLLDGIPDRAWVKDRDGRLVAANQPYYDACGKSPADIAGKTDRDIWPVELAEYFIASDLHTITTGKRYRFEEKITFPDGSTSWFETVKIPNYGESGEITGTTGIARDITERKLIEQALTRSEESYKEAENIARIGNWQWMIDRDEVIWSDGMFAILGLDPAGFGRTYSSYLDYVRPDDKERVMGLVAESLTGKPLDYTTTVLCPDGTEKVIHVYGRLSYGRDGRPERLFGTVQDITEKTMSDKALRASEERLRIIFENATIGIAVADPQGSIYEANPAFCRIVGYSEDELQGMTVAGITHPDDIEETRSQMGDLESGVLISIDTEKRYIRKDGDTVWARVTVTRHHVHGMLQPYNIALVEDITSRKAIEKQREELFTMLRHDMKTPLAVISGNAEMVIAEGGQALSRESAGMVEAIRSSAQSLGMMVDDLVAISRLETSGSAVPMERVDMVDLLLEVSVVAAERARAKGLNYTKSIPNELPQGTFNRSYLQRAVANLLDNAVKFTPEGGNVFLDAALVHENGGKCIRITVADTGPGIPEQEKEMVFEKYYRSVTSASPKGSGLGLAIVKAVAMLHGGNVELTGREGGGSVFTISLPAD